jgi:peptidoglycan hydrolase-like protein with peptidoglycan-binding domain
VSDLARQFTQKDAIINLQTYLRAQGVIYPNAKRVPIDGIFDTATKEALIEFQIRNSLEPTGIADRKTFDLLYAQYLEIIENTSLPNPIIPFPSYPIDYKIKRGDTSFLVSVVQYILDEIGIIYNVFESVEINGNYDIATENAVRNFQTINSLSPTGEVDRKTWNALSKIYNLSLHHIDLN